jgi:hypothetical protein
MNPEYAAAKMLRPQDVLVACKIFTFADDGWTYSRLGGALSISAGEAHNAVGRGKISGLITSSNRKTTVSKKKLFDLLTVSVPQIFYAQRQQVCLGVPTSIWAKELAGKFEMGKDDIPLVWPHPSGSSRGEGLVPLYPTVPKAVQHDSLLYEIMALVDVIRTAVEPCDRKLAVDLLGKIVWKEEKIASK